MPFVSARSTCQLGKISLKSPYGVRFIAVAHTTKTLCVTRQSSQGTFHTIGPSLSNKLNFVKAPTYSGISKSTHTDSSDMSSTNKKILVAGLGSSQDIPPEGKGVWTTDEESPVFQGQIDQAKLAGFDLQVYRVNTTLPHETIVRDLRTALRQEKWDGVTIGFGIRGNEEYTPIFEKMVNTVLEEIQPPPKFIFALRPHTVWEAVSRVYGVPQ